MLVSTSFALAATIGSSIIGLNSVKATTWTLTDTINPTDFESDFEWFTGTDPTNGLVTYQSLADAKTYNLSVVSNDKFVMAVDTTAEALSGRKSVRITSSKSYSDGIYV
jgi:hypothetical protein